MAAPASRKASIRSELNVALHASRKPVLRFTAEEKSMLISFVNKYKKVIECKKRDVSLSAKTQAWKRLCTEYNAQHGLTTRDFKQFKKCWGNLKQKCTEEKSEEKRNILKSIGQLKRRFHCLLGELRMAPHRCSAVTVPCCVLHNIAKLYACTSDDECLLPPEVPTPPSDMADDGNTVRNALVQQHFSQWLLHLLLLAMALEWWLLLLPPPLVPGQCHCSKTTRHLVVVGSLGCQILSQQCPLRLLYDPMKELSNPDSQLQDAVMETGSDGTTTPLPPEAKKLLGACAANDASSQPPHAPCSDGADSTRKDSAPLDAVPVAVATTSPSSSRMALFEKTLSEEKDIRVNVMREEHELRMRLLQEDQDDILKKKKQ
nr:uncharacterized protein LOC129381907 [Dermacentor andersoni]